MDRFARLGGGWAPVGGGHLPSRRRLPILPRTGPDALSLLGLSLDELYLFEAASGNVVGAVAGTTLVAAGTPTYRREAAGRAGVYYDGSGDRHTADVHPFGVASGWLGAVFEPAGAGAVLSQIIGRLTAGARGVSLYLQTTGWPTMLVRDNVPTTVLIGDGSYDLRAAGGVWLAQGQIDRAANQARFRVSQLGGEVRSYSGSIATIGTLTIAGQVFGHGSFGALAEGIANYWSGVATGAQCEGAGLLASVAARLGFE